MLFDNVIYPHKWLFQTNFEYPELQHLPYDSVIIFFIFHLFLQTDGQFKDKKEST